MAIEITSRARIRLPFWVIILGALTIILIIAFLVSYFYLVVSIKKISQEIQEKEPILSPLEENIRSKEGELAPLAKKIDNFAELLQKHEKPLNIFNFLEEVSLPAVWFSDFAFSSENGEVIVSGEADSFITLEQQILILKQEPFVKNLSVSEVSMGEGGEVIFTFLIAFNPQVFD